MAELQATGYQDLRTHIVENWTELKLKNEVGNTVYSVTIPNGNKVKWNHTTTEESVYIGDDMLGNPVYDYESVQSNPILELKINISGVDLTNLPCTIASMELYANGFIAPVIRETFSPVTMTINADILNYIAKIHIPS